MPDNYAIKGAMKGLLAGVRGVVSGKLAVKNAQTAAARKEATIALENRRQNMADAKAFFDQVRMEGEGGHGDQEREKIEQERLDDLNTDYTEAEEDLTGLEDELDMETDPDKRKMAREKISARRSRLLRIASRLGKRQSGIEVPKKAKTGESVGEKDKKEPVKKGLKARFNKVFGKLVRKKK